MFSDPGRFVPLEAPVCLAPALPITPVELPISVDGILHLAALSVALLVAYVGIDRIHPPDTLLQNEIDKTKSRVSDMLKQFDAVKSDGTVIFAYEIYAVFLLCHVAGEKVKVSLWKRLKNLLHFQLHAPLLPYFRNRFDLKLVAIMAFISTLVFLLITSADMWEIGFVHTHLFLRVAFVWYVFSLVFIFVTVVASAKLLRIGATCNYMRSKIDERLTELVELKIAAASILSTASTSGR